jgi:PAS domain S-box-containing protein
MPTAFSPDESQPGRRRPTPPLGARQALRATLWTLTLLLVVTLTKLKTLDAFGTAPPFLLYVSAIIVASLLGGWRFGLATTAISALLATFFFTPPYFSFRWVDPSHGVRLAMFVGEGIVITAITARMNAERRRADAARREAQESLAKLEGVMRGVQDGITVQSAEGQLVYANDAAARLTGFASAAALTKAKLPEIISSFELLTPEGAPFPVAELPGRRALAGLPAPEKLVRFRLKATGAERWALVRANAVRLGAGDVWHAVNVFQDVTEARAKDEALRVGREWFQTTLRSIGDAVIATDADGRVTFMNPVAEGLTRWSSAEAEGRPLSEVFPIVNEETRISVESPVERVLREGKIVGLANHTILIGRDGHEVAIDDSAAPIRDPGGAVAGTVLVFRDVSQKRAEERRKLIAARAAAELASSLDYERTLATVARLAVPAIADWCSVDTYEDGRLRRIAVEHVDPKKVELVYEIERRFPEDPASGGGGYEVARTGKPLFIDELTDDMLAASLRDPEHLALVRRLHLRSYVAVPLTSNGATLGVLSLAMAESGRKYGADDLALATAIADRAALAVNHARLFDAATRARDEAERANRTKDEFLAMLGHELRNPLAPILTALQLMKRRAPEALARERAVLERQIRYMVTLVDDLLDVSRIARGKIELAREAVDVAETVARALEMAGPILEERRHVVTRDVPEGLLVTGDAVRLAQVVANLLTNAAKYTEAGGHITISAAAESGEIVLQVRDDGVGIAPDLLPRIFELFVQGGQALDRDKGGLGLGLAIVRSVVALHGGRVTAASAGRGQGSTFEVRLPARADRTDPSAQVPVAPAPATASGLDILVVDDNVDALELLADALVFAGHRAYQATNADEALAIARAHRPAVALLDIGLPIVDGYELARRLRALGDPALKLVAITGYGAPADREKTRAAGFNAHLVKPVALDELERVIARVVASAT